MSWNVLIAAALIQVVWVPRLIQWWANRGGNYKWPTI